MRDAQNYPDAILRAPAERCSITAEPHAISTEQRSMPVPSFATFTIQQTLPKAILKNSRLPVLVC